MHFKIAGFKVHASAVLGAAALACLAAYVAFRASLFGVAAFLFLVSAIAADVLLGDAPLGSKKEKRELKKLALEIGVTAAVAVAAWVALCLALQTSSPLNVVTSCSMLPALERGDFIILQGEGTKAQEVSVDFPLSSAFTRPNNLFFFDGWQPRPFANYSLSHCVRIPVSGVASENFSSEPQGCTSGININGVFFNARNNNDIIVYESNVPGAGLIIHRVLARIRAPDGVYYVTKGDNNLAADQQGGMILVPESAVKGRVVGRIPFIGYFKLLLFLQFDFPQGCDKTLRYLN